MRRNSIETGQVDDGFAVRQLATTEGASQTDWVAVPSADQAVVAVLCDLRAEIGPRCAAIGRNLDNATVVAVFEVVPMPETES